MAQKLDADDTPKAVQKLNLMHEREHVVIAYGQELGYQHGAKFQILSAWKRWYSQPGINVCVVTDKPNLFEGYPVRTIRITEQNWRDWSLNGLQHFGIKLRALEQSMRTTDAPVSMLLDTDTYWIRNPESLARVIEDGRAVMFCDEGAVKGTRNTSIDRFNEGLANQSVAWGELNYQLSSQSRMLNSSIVGLHKKNIEILVEAFRLFKVLEPLVNAHTVEQFALAETLRVNKIEVKFGSAHTRDWSSIGRKNYATPILKQFFEKHGENDFEKHLENLDSIVIRRPLKTLLKQKLARFRGLN